MNRVSSTLETYDSIERDAGGLLNTLSDLFIARRCSRCSCILIGVVINSLHAPREALDGLERELHAMRR